MNKLQALTAISAAALGMLASGCSLLGGNDNPVEYLAVQEETDGAWSFMDREGNIVLRDEFTGTAFGVYNGMFAVWDDQKYTLYTFDEKKPKAVRDCEDLKDVGLFSEGLIPVVKVNERITLIDKDGETKFVLEPYKNKEIASCYSHFSEGLMGVRLEDETYGYVDTKGNMVVEPKYSFINAFNEGLAVVGILDQESEDNEYNYNYKIIDKKGKEVFHLKKEWTVYGQFEKGRLAVSSPDGHMYIADKKGEMEKCPSKVNAIGSFGKKAYSFSTTESKWGLMSYDGEVIVRAKYEFIQALDDGNWLATKDGAFEILNAEGEVENTVDDYNYPTVVADFGISAREKDTYQFFNFKGEEMRNANFADYNLPIDRMVESDFFNAEGFAADIANLITENGLGKYTFSTPPGEMATGSPDDYRYTREIELGNLAASGYRYTITAGASFDQSVTTYNYNSATHAVDYSWNPECKVGFFVIEASCIEVDRDMIDTVLSALQKKGFTEIASKSKDSDKVLIVLKKGDTLLGLISEIGSYRIRVELVHDENGLIADNIKAHINEM